MIYVCVFVFKLRFVCYVCSGRLGSCSPRYTCNFIADVVEKIAPAVVHIDVILRCCIKYT